MTGAVVYPDARQLLSLGLDGVAKVWRVENEEFLCQGGAGLSALGISRCAAAQGVFLDMNHLSWYVLIV